MLCTAADLRRDHERRGRGRDALGAFCLFHEFARPQLHLDDHLRHLGLSGQGANFTNPNVLVPDMLPDDTHGQGIEKPWVAAVDAFAIGGHCQVLLAMDYVLAADDAYLTLPARKEGIIPGAANLRLWRFTGDRIARQAILYGRRLDCDSAEGRLVCDEVVPPADMDRALAAVIDNFTSSGVVSAAGNRRAIRVGQEPFDLFRQYMAVYAREQAHCHFSPALIANLERHWNAQARSA